MSYLSDTAHALLPWYVFVLVLLPLFFIKNVYKQFIKGLLKSSKALS